MNCSKSLFGGPNIIERASLKFLELNIFKDMLQPIKVILIGLNVSTLFTKPYFTVTLQLEGAKHFV